MPIEIKHRITGNILLRLNLGSLRGADLRGADLRGADLRGAGLIIYQFRKYTAYIQLTHTRIGRKYYTNKEWFNFTDDEIAEMGGDALAYWRRAKPVIQAMVASLQNENDGGKTNG